MQLKELYLEQKTDHRHVKRDTWYYDYQNAALYNEEAYNAGNHTGFRPLLEPTLDELLTMLLPVRRRDSAAYNEIDLFLVCGNNRRNQPELDWFNTRYWHRTEFSRESQLWATYANEYAVIHLHGTGMYFGEKLNVHFIINARRKLTKELRSNFGDEKLELKPTAAGTGRMLIEMSLPRGMKYQKQGDNLNWFLADNFGQGRFEVFDEPYSSDGVERWDRIDGRLMYASCVSHLPVGPVESDEFNEFDGVWTSASEYVEKIPGFYHVSFKVPDTWDHIGLLPVLTGVKCAHSSYGKFYWPNDAGHSYGGWVTSSELALAIQEKWDVTIHQRILWPETHNIPDPLATWRKHIVSLYLANSDGYIRAGLRSIALNTLGSFNQFTKIEQHSNSREQFKAMTAKKVHRIIRSNAKVIEWIEEKPLTGERAKWVHPEFSKSLWGRARARTNRQALKLPFAKIIAITGDEMHCNQLDQNELEDIRCNDTGKPGAFRLKATSQGPIPWPENEAQLLAFLTSQNMLKENEA